MPWRNIFSRPGSPPAVLVWAIVASIVLLLLGERSQQRIASGVVVVAYAPFGHLRNLVDDIAGVYRENEQLEKRLVEAMLQNMLLMEAESENARFRALLDYEPFRHGRAIPAEILGPAAPGSRSLWIDAGADDSVTIGRPVVTSQGLVGKVIDVRSRSSLVRSIWDFGCKVAAIAQRSRVVGIVEAHRTGQLRMQYVPRDADLQLGDSIVSSGWGLLFPNGLPIGTVSAIDTSQASYFLTIEIEPLVDFSRVEDVFVIEGPADSTVIGRAVPR